jgi:hypothetical protein
VDVHVALLEHLVLDAEATRAAPDHGAGGLDRLLHHVAELSGADDVALARHHRRLDRQEIPADFGPREARPPGPTWFFFSAWPKVELAHAQVVVEVVLDDDDLAVGLVELGSLHHLAADLRDLALERSEHRLHGCSSERCRAPPTR